jgi:hypothetical protein
VGAYCSTVLLLYFLAQRGTPDNQNLTRLILASLDAMMIVADIVPVLWLAFTLCEMPGM